jgi:hypothetical protein
MLLLLPLVGATTSFVVWKAILAAYSIVGELKQARDLLLQIMSRKYAYENTGREMYSPARIIWGDSPPQILPLIMLFVWLILLVCAVNVVIHSPDFHIVLSTRDFLRATLL